MLLSYGRGVLFLIDGMSRCCKRAVGRGKIKGKRVDMFIFTALMKQRQWIIYSDYQIGYILLSYFYIWVNSYRYNKTIEKITRQKLLISVDVKVWARPNNLNVVPTLKPSCYLNGSWRWALEMLCVLLTSQGQIASWRGVMGGVDTVLCFTPLVGVGPSAKTIDRDHWLQSEINWTLEAWQRLLM